MSDYRVKVTVRNARILRAIERIGMQPGAIFADRAGIRYGTLNDYISLKRSPITEDGMYRPCALRLCEALNCSPSDLWSDEQLDPIERNSAHLDIGQDTLDALIAGDQRVAVDALLETLPERQSMVLRRRFGFDGEAETLDEIGRGLGVTSARVRQIEQKALRIIRWNGYREDLTNPKVAKRVRLATELREGVK